MLMPTKILVPTGFSEYSDSALEQALDIAKQYKAKVFLLHVLPEEIHHTIAFDFGLSEDLWRQIKDRHWAETKEKLHSNAYGKSQGEVLLIFEGRKPISAIQKLYIEENIARGKSGKNVG